MLVKMQSNKQIFSSIISENRLFSIRKMKTNKNFVKSRTCCPSEIEDFGDKKNTERLAANHKMAVGCQLHHAIK